MPDIYMIVDTIGVVSHAYKFLKGHKWHVKDMHENLNSWGL